MSPESITCSNGKLTVPNNPIIPVIVGDGIGQDVTPVAMKVIDAAVKKAYEMGAREIVIIRTYEQEFIRKVKLENYIAALATKSYPKISQALKKNAATYNSALEFINNPPNDCKIIQICPPKRLKTKRATIDHDTLKNDYEIGVNEGLKYIKNLP